MEYTRSFLFQSEDNVAELFDRARKARIESYATRYIHEDFLVA